MDAMDLPVAYNDRGLTLGLGLFETILGVDKQFVLLDRHLKRFRESCHRLGWGVVLPDVESILLELLERNELSVGRVRVRMTMTSGSGWVNRATVGTDAVLWMQAVVAGQVPEFASVEISPFLRNERSAVVGLKCLSYAENVLALDLAQRHGHDECLFFNTQGHLCEGGTSNVFFVKSGVIYTPSLDSGCLPGVTRQVVMEMCKDLEINCLEGSYTREMLDDADEIFLTSSIRGVMGIGVLGEKKFGSMPVTMQLRDRWDEGLRKGNFL